MKLKDNEKDSHYTSSITDVEFNKNQFARYLSIILTFVFITIVVIAIIFYSVFNQILNFDFNMSSPFQTSPYSIIILLTIICLLLFLLTYCLINNKDSHLLLFFYNEISGFYMIMIMLLIGPFLFGLIYNNSYYSLSINLILSFSCLIFTFLIFKKIKNKKNVTFNTLLTINIGNSLIMSLMCYVTLFNIASIICFENLESNLKIDMGIAICCIYGALAVAILADYKDITFSLCLEIIVLGNFTFYYKLTKEEFIAGIVICSFVFLAVVLTIFKYKKMIYGYEDDEELIRALDKHRGSHKI